MKKLQILWLFYRKILFNSAIITLALTILTGGAIGQWTLAFPIFTFCFLFPFTHLFFYEIGRPVEYYFFANLGFHKPLLWKITLSASVILPFISAILLK